MIAKELLERKEYLGNEEVESIYFGGGTPSLLPAGKIESLLNLIGEEYNVAAEPEITLEANPDDLDQKKSVELKSAGINRLSIGIQSFFDNDLKFMNRAHDASQALQAVTIARKAGFQNISIDLIYGLPLSTPHQWAKNLKAAFELEVDHLSCYALTVEPRTVLADLIRKKKVSLPDDDRTIGDFELLMDRASKAGFEHYEISNFAYGRKYSKHNTSYWQRRKYLGVGPSAHSYDVKSRQWNISNNPEYIRSLKAGKLAFEREVLTPENKHNEYILTALRTMWGIDLSLVESEFGNEKKNMLLMLAESYYRNKMLDIARNKITLTNKGKFIADRIASDLFI